MGQPCRCEFCWERLRHSSRALDYIAPCGIKETRSRREVVSFTSISGSTDMFLLANGYSFFSTAIYYGAATISGAFSGLIAYAIQKTLTLERTGKEPWRWLFIIEGSMALFVGALVLIILPRFPDQLRGRKHWLFTPEEVELAIQRMRCKFTA